MNVKLVSFELARIYRATFHNTVTINSYFDDDDDNHNSNKYSIISNASIDIWAHVEVLILLFRML